jgi:POT family proton-dependent oligopeptide transporter
MWERFSYYGMRALLVLYMVKELTFSTERAGNIYGLYTGLVYLTPLIGGYIADRYIGQKNSIIIGGILMMLGHFAIAVPHLSFFYIALALLIIGNGFFKPNISTIVGQLYGENDPRRDGGFTIFYMGINLGAFLSPLVCGTLGEKIGFHYGFASAGIGMLFGLLIFLWGQNRFIKELGNKPISCHCKEVESLKELTIAASCHSEGFSPKNLSVLESKPKDHSGQILLSAQDDKPITKEEKQKIAVIFILMFFSIFFWASFEQAGSSMTLFADRSTDRMIPFINKVIPVSWFQSVNPLIIMLLAPLFSKLWLDLADINKNPSTPVKFAIGLILISIGFLVMVAASSFAETSKVSFFWLIGVYFFHTVGELCISPVGLSVVTKLAPVKFASLLMAVWFLSSFFANSAAGFFAGSYDSLKTTEFFIIPALITGISGLIMFLISKHVKKWMHGVD